MPLWPTPAAPPTCALTRLGTPAPCDCTDCTLRDADTFQLGNLPLPWVRLPDRVELSNVPRLNDS